MIFLIIILTMIFLVITFDIFLLVTILHQLGKQGHDQRQLLVP